MNLHKKLCWTLLLFICAATLSCSGSAKNATNPQPSAGKRTAKVLADDFQVTSDPNDQSQPAVAYDTVSHKKYLTVYVDNKNGSQIRGTICVGSDSPGQGQANNVTSVTANPDFTISTNLTGNTSQPKVAFDPTDSRYLVVWTDSRNGYGQIYGQFVDTAGSLIGNNFQISTHTAGVDINQNDPDLIYNAVTNKFVVAWIDTTTSDSTNSKNYVAGGVTNPLTNFVTVSYIPLPFSDNNMVRTAQIDPTTSAVTTVTDVSKAVSNGAYVDDGAGTITQSWNVHLNEAHPKLSYSPISGELFVAWSGTTSTVTLTIKYSLATVAGVTTASYLSVSFASVDQDAGLTKIKFYRNQGLGLVRVLSFGTLATNPALAVDPNTNRLLIAWEDNNGGSATGKNILGQLMDLSGFTTYGNLITISAQRQSDGSITAAVGDQSSPVAAFDNVNERFFIAWEDARNQSSNLSNIDIYSQFVDPQGTLSGGNAIVTVASGNQLAPAVAFGDVPFRKFFVVWKDGRGLANADIYGQMMEFSSSPQLVLTDSTDNPGPLLSGALDFGNVPIGSTKDISIKIRNDGNSPLVIQQPVQQPDAPFTFQTPPPTSINPGTAYDMTIRFAPIAAGAYGGNAGNNYKLTLNSNGGLSVLFLSGSGTGTVPLTITTTALQDTTPTLLVYPATIATLTASGGVNPYKWSSTALPAGLALNATTGVLTQIGPVASGVLSIPFTVADGNSPVQTASRTLTLNVGALGISSTSLPTGTQNSLYSATLATSGVQTGTFTWSVPASGVGALPSGLTLDPTSGVISGTPTASGNFSVIVTLQDKTGSTLNASATKTLSLTINPAPSVITTSLPLGVLGTAYHQQLLMAGGTLPAVWELTGSLPPGLSFDTGTGVISGTPSASGTYNFSAVVTDFSLKASIPQPLTIVINKLLDISTPTSGAGAPLNVFLGQSFTFTFAGSGGTPPYTWTAGATRPTGLNLSPFTGVFSGTPSELGTFVYTVQLVDSSLASVSKTYTTVVSAPTSITTTAALSPWTVNATGFSQTLAATGGSGSGFKWSITAGNGAGTLTPVAGLTLDANTGVISGTPTAAGSFSFTVTATDTSVSTLTVSKLMTLVVDQAPVISTVTLPDAVQFSSYSRTLAVSGGTSPFIWTMTAGSLPTGLTLNTQTGVISGTPSVASAAQSFTVKVTDAAGATSSTTLSIGIAAGTAPSNTAVPSSGGGKSGCFIATAAYGSYLDPQVMVLRHFRDDVLLKSGPGTAFVAFYYKHSPPIADFIREHEFLRMLTRWALTPLICAVKYPLALGALVLVGLLFLVRRRLQVRRARQTCNA
jgi:hypothetical protein